MLRQRVITAVVLLVVLLAVLAAPGLLPLALFLLLVLVLGLFEWWRMTLATRTQGLEAAEIGEPPSWPQLILRQTEGWRRIFTAFTVAVAVALFLRLWLDYAYLGAVLVEVLGESTDLFVAGSAEREAILGLIFGRLWLWAAIGWVVACLYLAVAKVDGPPFSLLLTVFGLLALPAAGAALLAAYDRGFFYLLSLLGIVWTADITAYFVGRAAGGAKLAPRISPGKTWSGALGGVAGVLILVAVLAWAGEQWNWRTLASDLRQVWGWGGALIWALVLAALSIAGDLFESLLKRRAGRKDSSQLLPGHGGVLDRIDAVLPVAPLAMLLVL
ncbi:MAG: phosphatidate cytidylyltransferase [Pigmentiphaga sp.]|nr:phosphatidate cytidylyltransferase [Pigmentiphaga sp.]